MITSTSNTQIKNVINLIEKSKDRKAQGLCVVEGKRMFEETPRERIHSLFVSESYEKENRGSLSGYDYETVSDEIFSHMSDTKTPQGIMALVKMRQFSVEDMIQDVEKDCAVVILDASDGGVAAMACTPSFDPNDVGTHLESDGDELVNKATQGEYAPGSVFKIAVAAAALENGVDIDCSYDCTGSVSVGDLQVKCETGGDDGHGSIGFEDAFAQSCNSFFIKLGQEIGADDIIETAQKLGLGKKALTGYPQESAGHLMTSGERSGDAIANLSIGQGETLVTPLQVAHMTGIIASGGIDRGVHMLMEEEAGNERVISGKTAGAIAAMMEKTTESGTGSGLDMTARDGSAEADSRN